MPERRESKPKKLDLDGELGLSRRDLLRRGAVVGGTLLWVAPAIQSLSPAASAQAARTQGPSPGTCAACYCWNGADKQNPTGSPTLPQDECSDDGIQGFRFSADACENWCKHNAPFVGLAGSPGGPYQHSEYCSGSTSCVCNSENDAGVNGVFCT